MAAFEQFGVESGPACEFAPPVVVDRVIPAWRATRSRRGSRAMPRAAVRWGGCGVPVGQGRRTRKETGTLFDARYGHGVRVAVAVDGVDCPAARGEEQPGAVAIPRQRRPCLRRGSAVNRLTAPLVVSTLGPPRPCPAG